MDIEGLGEKESPNDGNGEKDDALSEGHRDALANHLKADSVTQFEKQEDADILFEAKPARHHQQMSNGNIAFWERFLNVRTIRVLLVENDDSTRYVVTALLRNCNYEVMNAANAMQAWRILEDLSNHIDIVLTEVVMPVLSGIGLLHKIMSHKTRKNTPVVMISSHDSMGLVFKCLSRGAVDFLVKPIRKNELKILWQHVWRRCQSSSGSGSESGTQAQKSLKSNSSERSGDNGENDGSNGQSTGGGSDSGSGAQSSWTRQAVDLDSPCALSPACQIAECPESTCAQVISFIAEKSDNFKVQVSLGMDGQQPKHPENAEKKDRELEALAERAMETKSGDPVREPNISSAKESESTSPVANRININHYANGDSKEASVELSLKRLRGTQDTERCSGEERSVLRRSEQSAFSRYNTSTNASKAPNDFTGSSTIIDNSIEATKGKFVQGTQVHSSNQTLHQSSNGVSNIADMGSTAAKFTKINCEGTSATDGFNPSSFNPVDNELRHNQQQASVPDGVQLTGSSSGSKHNFEIRYPNSQGFNSSGGHLLDQPSSNPHESSSVKLAVDASRCGSTNALTGPMDVENGHYSFNKSNSGSNHASNGPNGSNPATNTAGNNAESGVDQVGKSGNGDANDSFNGNRDEESKLKRAAAMIKLRQKKKDRCFKKKVQYQNRKKIAEQRPRIKGQFARPAESDSSYRTRDEEQ